MNLKFELFSIKIIIHWSWYIFCLLFLWPIHSIYETIFNLIICIFLGLSILIHELAHSLVAKKFDIMTKSITLFLLGGVAIMPHNGKLTNRQELKIAWAGPQSNFLIVWSCLVIYMIMSLYQKGLSQEIYLLSKLLDLTSWILYFNLVMGLFNLIPAYPLDGGRILKSLLGIYLPYDIAIRVSRYVGGFLGLALLLLSFYLLSPISGLIAILIIISSYYLK